MNSRTNRQCGGPSAVTTSARPSLPARQNGAGVPPSQGGAAARQPRPAGADVWRWWLAQWAGGAAGERGQRDMRRNRDRMQVVGGWSLFDPELIVFRAALARQGGGNTARESTLAPCAKLALMPYAISGRDRRDDRFHGAMSGSWDGVAGRRSMMVIQHTGLRIHW